MPKVLTSCSAFQRLCRATRKWGIIIVWVTDCPSSEVVKACPWLKADRDSQVLADCQGIVLCKSEKEVMRLYRRVVGDDGPTKFNPYKGPCRVYALTCSPTGRLQHENT